MTERNEETGGSGVEHRCESDSGLLPRKGDSVKGSLLILLLLLLLLLQRDSERGAE